MSSGSILGYEGSSRMGVVSLCGVEVKNTAEGEHGEGESGHSGVLETHREVKSYGEGRTFMNSLSHGPTFPFFELQHAMRRVFIL